MGGMRNVIVLPEKVTFKDIYSYQHQPLTKIYHLSFPETISMKHKFWKCQTLDKSIYIRLEKWKYVPVCTCIFSLNLFPLFKTKMEKMLAIQLWCTVSPRSMMIYVFYNEIPSIFFSLYCISHGPHICMGVLPSIHSSIRYSAFVGEPDRSVRWFHWKLWGSCWRCSQAHTLWPSFPNSGPGIQTFPLLETPKTSCVQSYQFHFISPEHDD